MWKTSTWERLWSVPAYGNSIDFSPDGLRVFVEQRNAIHAYDVWSGDALGKIESMTNSMHDHVHRVRGEVGGIWECTECKRSLLKNCEYWLTKSDRWLWVVEERVARRLIHILEYFDECFHAIKAHSGYVAVGTHNGPLVLDTACNSEAV